MNAWSLALSVLGAALGIISAYAKLKRFSVNTIKAAGQAAIRSAERDNTLADIFLEQPAALVAFITYRVLGGGIIFAIGIALLSSSGALSANLPASAVKVLGFFVSGIFANLVTSPVLISWKVYRRALARAMDG